MDAETLRKYEQAGRIAAQALKFGIKRIEPGANMREVLDEIEEFIRDKGAQPAFPAQSCVNNVAAHFCPTESDNILYMDGDLVKLDVGVHVDGFIGDNATTVSLGGEHEQLCEAVRHALSSAQKVLRAGCLPDEVGHAIAETIAGYGLQPVRNLTGHGLGRFKVHVKPTMPNCPSGERMPLEEGMVVAIEPFATNGTAGMIYNSSNPTIFSLIADRPVRTPYGRQVLEIVRRYNGLPFTTRWLTKELGSKAVLGLAELRRARLLAEYPPLPEKSGGLVAQHEKTFLVTKTGCRSLTEE